MVPAFSLIIPAFNEEERVGQTLRTVLQHLREFSPQSEVIVVDDGSSDATADVVRDVLAGAGEIEVRLLEQAQNHGKGFAVRHGLGAATRPIALFSDADLSTPIEEASKLLDPIAAGELDVAFGSRALNRRLIGNRQAWHREQAGRTFNLLVRLATGLPYWDTQCGFKAFRLEAFRPVLAQAKSDGFSFDVELLYLARKAGLRMREIPVRWNHHDGSKVHFVHDSLHMLREVVSMRFR
jgi:glycosyltransferase involved in cell wall biosynthesis